MNVPMECRIGVNTDDEGMNTMDDTMDNLAQSREMVSPWKYGNDRMAAYLYALMLDGDNGDDETNNGMGDWAIRYGRRVLRGDDQGFVACERYVNAREAENVIDAYRVVWEMDDDDETDDEMDADPYGDYQYQARCDACGMRGPMRDSLGVADSDAEWHETMTPAGHRAYVLDGHGTRGYISADETGWCSISDDDEYDPDHVHQWGPVEEARFTGNPHRKCSVPGCNFVSLDLDDE